MRPQSLIQRCLFTLPFIFLFLTSYLFSQISSCGWPITSTSYFTFSNSSNTQVLNGTSWGSAVEIPCTRADLVWLSAIFPVTTRFWEPLYNNGACWVSIPGWDSAVGNFRRTFRQIISPTVNLTNVQIDFCVDDSIAVYLDGTYIGSGSQFDHLNTVNIGNLSASTHEIKFEVFNLRPTYFGFIYGLRGDTLRSECNWPITRHDYCQDRTTGRYLISNSTNTQIWNGTTWAPAINVPTNVADGIWGTALGLPPPYPWQSLYDNGACWVSRNNAGRVIGNPDTLFLRHSFSPPSTAVNCLYRLTIDFCVDDSLFIYYNSGSQHAPGSGVLVGSGGGFGTINSASFFVIGNIITIDFKIVSTRRSYIGLIYGIRCEEICSICDSILVNVTPTRVEENNCCYQFNIFNNLRLPLPINGISFVTTPSNSITSANGPAGWIFSSTPPNTVIAFTGTSILPGNNIFTLCFSGSNSNLPCTVHLYFYNQYDCKYPLNLQCQSCCDSFRVNLKSYAYQLDNQRIFLNTEFINIIPNPNLVRVLAYVAYAKRDTYWPHLYFDIEKARSLYGIPSFWSGWQPPGTPPNTRLGQLILNPALGLKGIWGSHQLIPGFARELIWGNYDLRNISEIGVINNYRFQSIFLLPPPIFPHEIVKFGVRYMFTDSTCCTCDTLLHYQIRRFPRRDPISSIIILETAEKGKFTIYNHRPIDVEDSSFIVLGYDFRSDTLDASVLQLRHLKDGTITKADSKGVCKVPISLQLGDSATFEILFSNPKKIYRIPFTATAYVLIEGDTIPIDYYITAVLKSGGDEVAISEGEAPQNPQTVAILLKNNNIVKEKIAKIVFKPKNKEKILAVGSNAINMKAQLGVYSSSTEQQTANPILMPDAGPPLLKTELDYQGEIRPIFLTFESESNKTAQFIFETYNKNNEIISDGEIIIPLTGVRETLDNNELISNLSLSPNPCSSDYLSISFLAKEALTDVSINLYDFNGVILDKVLKNSPIRPGINTIVYSVSLLPSGTYFIQITSKSFEAKSTFIIIR